MNIVAVYICSYCSAIPATPTLDRWGHESGEARCVDCLGIEHQPFDPDAPIDETNRAAVLRWLVRNDHNGCYPDREIREELGDDPLTLEQLLGLYREQRYGDVYSENPAE